MSNTYLNTQSQAIASLTWLFSRLLCAIHQVSSSTRDASSRRGASRRAKTRCKKSLVADGGHASADLRDGDAKWLCAELSGLFIFFFSALQSLHSTNPDLLEGPLYILFSESGEVLHRFMLINQPDGSVGEKAVEMPQVLEVQSLAWILERVLALLQQVQRPNVSIATPAMEKLQNTLLYAVFKTNDISLANRLYPVQGHDMERPQGLDDPTEDVGSWFMGEIWRLLGGDIFTRMKGADL